MASDKNGNPIQKGDVVMVPCKVLWSFDDQPGNKINVRTVEPNPEDGEPTHIALSGAQVQKQG